MSAASTIGPSDSFMLIQNGSNKQTTVTNFLKNLNSNDHIRLNPVQNAIDIRMSSKDDANLFVMRGTLNRVGLGTSDPQSKFHVSGNIQSGSASSDGVLVQSSEHITYTSADQTGTVTKILSPLRALSTIVCDTGVSGLFSLSNGSNGQIKTISVSQLDIGKSVTIDCAGIGYNRVTLNDVGESIVIQFSTAISAWIAIGGNGYILSTV